jgi:DNA-binding response OmpR family regulator
MKILVLEDNERLLNVIKISLEKENYKVDTFIDGNDALESLENGYCCFILDINVPIIDGISLLELIRMNHPKTPCLIISSNTDLEKIKKSYDLGCNDYLKKPFYMLELIQKVKKLCILEKKFLKLDDVYKYDFTNTILYKNNDEVELTKKEILFLELFCSNLHHVSSYSELEEYVWEGEETNLTNIRAMIKRLRKKIPHESIVIVKGLGYCLNKNVSLV